MGTPTNSAIVKYMNTKIGAAHLPGDRRIEMGRLRRSNRRGPWAGIPTYRSEGVIYGKYIRQEHEGRQDRHPLPERRLRKDFVAGFKAGSWRSQADKLIVKELTYEVSDPTIDSQIVTLKASGANVLFSASTDKVGSADHPQGGEIDWRPTHFLVQQCHLDLDAC